MNHNFGNIQPHDVYRTYKNMFRGHLFPFLQMMSGLQPEMEAKRWIVMTNGISSRVIANPEQYVGRDIPRSEITTMIIQEIFDEFVRENAVADVAITA